MVRGVIMKQPHGASEVQLDHPVALASLLEDLARLLHIAELMLTSYCVKATCQVMDKLVNFGASWVGASSLEKKCLELDLTF